jgi:hypothetical protein
LHLVPGEELSNGHGKGWMNSGSIFQNRVNRALRDKCYMPDIDDIIIYSKNIKEQLEQVFKRLKVVGFHLKLRKCEFYMEQIEFLGHTITKDDIRPNIDKIRAIVNMPPPNTKSKVKSFLGLGSYYQRFIKSFARRTYYIKKLTKG